MELLYYNIFIAFFLEKYPLNKAIAWKVISFHRKQEKLNYLR